MNKLLFKSLVAFVAILLLGIVSRVYGGGEMETEGYEANTYPSSIGYVEAMAAGQRWLEQEKYDLAFEKYLEALRYPIHESPNYQPVVGLAEAKCGLGQFAEGQQLLRDYECMTKVFSGELACAESASGYRRDTSKAMTVLCNLQMCWEEYLPYTMRNEKIFEAELKISKRRLESARKKCSQ